MGGRDPRGHRNQQGLLIPETLLEHPLFINRRQRLAVKPIKKLAPLGDDATIEDLRDKVNELIDALSMGGLM